MTFVKFGCLGYLRLRMIWRSWCLLLDLFLSLSSCLLSLVSSVLYGLCRSLSCCVSLVYSDLSCILSSLLHILSCCIKILLSVL